MTSIYGCKLTADGGSSSETDGKRERQTIKKDREKDRQTMCEREQESASNIGLCTCMFVCLYSGQWRIQRGQSGHGPPSKLAKEYDPPRRKKE